MKSPGRETPMMIRRPAGVNAVADHPATAHEKRHPERFAIMDELVTLADRGLVDLHGFEVVDSSEVRRTDRPSRRTSGLAFSGMALWLSAGIDALSRIKRPGNHVAGPFEHN
jgi:hypothetical protein